MKIGSFPEKNEVENVEPSRSCKRFQKRIIKEDGGTAWQGRKSSNLSTRTFQSGACAMHRNRPSLPYHDAGCKSIRMSPTQAHRSHGQTVRAGWLPLGAGLRHLATVGLEKSRCPLDCPLDLLASRRLNFISGGSIMASHDKIYGITLRTFVARFENIKASSFYCMIGSKVIVAELRSGSLR
eukprot:g65542.t1